MLRAAALIALGWILMAAVAGLGHAFGLTLALPATSVVLVTHLAYDRERSLPFGLAVVIALGYLEDLHQGLPTGALALAFALVYLLLAWTSLRLAPTGLVIRAITAGLACLLVDLLTWVILTLLADPLGVAREGLAAGLRTIHWHALATLLAAPAISGILGGLEGLARRPGARGAAPGRPGPAAPRPGPLRARPRPSPSPSPRP